MPPHTEDTRWFTDEVQPHAPHLKAYLRGSFPAVRDVDDVVQESFLRLWKARAAAPILSARALLFTVARRIALNVVRKHRNAPFAEASEDAIAAVASDTPDSLDALIARERIDLLADALIALPPRCREIVIRHKVQGLPQKAVAAELGLSERTVETQVRNGVARCHAYLQARGIEVPSAS